MELNTKIRNEATTVAGKEYYDRNYADYDRQNAPGKLRFYKKLIQLYIEPGRRLFEVGVGCGNFLGEVRHIYQCGGCDINDYGLLQAERYVTKASLYKGSTEVLCKVQNKPDVIVAWDVLEHIEYLDNALGDIRSNLVEHGYLMAVVPVYDGPLGHITRWLDDDPTHLTKEDRCFWLAKIQKADFRIVLWGGIIRRLLIKRYYLHLTRPQWLLRHCGTAIYIVAQKVNVQSELSNP
ncbi:MAG: methyltransferase domain-containing protein [Verrucomicrobiae bacterium]|nr:methyltransferase domain-containing protein [Verrucomicrobiae bacterium]